LTQGGIVSQLVAILLLAMSVASWVVILWKTWLLRRAAATWRAAPPPSGNRPRWRGREKVAAFDREALVLPLIAATDIQAGGTLATAGDKSQQLTRVLRDALHGVLHKLQFGQVLLATVGSTAPFVGLLGTVWGIYHALVGIAAAGQITIDKVSGPVGEALIMTAAGLAVAIPAVLAYNIFGRLHRPHRSRPRRLRPRPARTAGAQGPPRLAMAFGRLERTPGPQPMSDINVTPLVDVMLVLVVIFIITAPLLASTIRLDLPKTDAAKPADAPKFVTLVVDKGRPGLPERPARDLDQLAARLAETAARTPRPKSSCAPTRACPTARWCR
jgi:biopolymer transport protein ExbB